MSGKKFFRIAVVAFVVMTVVVTPLIYAVLFKPKGIAPAEDPELSTHLLSSGLWAAAMSVLQITAYWVGIRMERRRTKVS